LTTTRRWAAILSAALAAPAALFFFAAIGRTLQPIDHEPARTLNAVVAWFLGAGGLKLLVLLLVLPSIALLLAATALWRTWQTDQSLRSDLVAFGRAAIPLLRRPWLLLAALVAGFGAFYLIATFVHAMTG
jgi:hypothetical protein